MSTGDKKLKIGLIHATMNSVMPICKAFSVYQEEVETINFMDEGVIFELRETKTVTSRMVMRLAELAWKAVESDVDGILFTCSSFTPYVEKISELMPVPVLSSDISMLELATEKGSKIGVIATIEAAGPTTTNMLYDVADRKNKTIEVDTHIILEAFEALQNGRENEHDRLIEQKANEIYEKNDITILAQYSMARAFEKMPADMKEYVLTGPIVSAKAIIEASKSNLKGS